MPVKTFIALRQEGRGVAEENDSEDLSEETASTGTTPSYLERLEATWPGRCVLSTWERPRGRWLLLTLLGIAYGIAGYVTIMGDFGVSTFLVYAWDVVPVVVGYRVSPMAGAWVGATGSLATGSILLRDLWGFRDFHFYLAPVILVAVLAGALLGALPARYAPDMDRRRLVLVLLACSVVVGFTDVTPVLAARIMGRARIVNLWVWPVMSMMSLTMYILIVAPLARGLVKDDRWALGRAFLVMVVVSIISLIPYEGPQMVSPERFEPFIDPVHPLVTDLAGELAPASLTEVERINATYRFVRDNITYIDDPPIVGDYLQPPDETLERGYGDCEDVSILLVSLLRSEGFDASVDVIPGHARVALPWNGSIYVLDATSADEFQCGG